MAEQQTLIAPGCEVVMHYTLTLEDCTEADSTRGEEPLRFVVGDGTLTEGLETVLCGLGAGDNVSLLLAPEQAFGQRDDENVHAMDRSAFAEDMALQPGAVVGFNTPAGDELAGIVLEVDEETVRVDFNHPLAGHNLLFDVEILAVEPPADAADN